MEALARCLLLRRYSFRLKLEFNSAVRCKRVMVGVEIMVGIGIGTKARVRIGVDIRVGIGSSVGDSPRLASLRLLIACELA